MIFEFTFLTLVVIDVIEEICVEVGPFLESILLSEKSWSHVFGNQSSLYEQRTTATHRIDKVGISLPSREQDHTSSQYLVEWGFHTFLTVASAMQRLTAGVKAQRTMILCDMHIQSDIGISH